MCTRCLHKVDRTRPVVKTCLGELTGNDRTLWLQRPVSFIGRVRSRLMTVESGHVADIERPDAEGQRPVSLTGASGQPALCPVKGYNGSNCWGFYLKPHGRLKLYLLHIFIDIAIL